MGAETSVVIALFFAGFLAAAAVLYSSFDYNSDLVKNAQDKKDIIIENELRTAIDITNISYTNISYSGSYLNITVKNTGTTTLNASLLKILIDGVYYNVSFTLSPSGNLLVPGNSTNISFYGIVAGVQDATIIFENADYYDCRDNGGSSCTDTTTHLYNFDVGSGTNRLLVVGLHYYTNPGTTTVKYEGVSLTRAMRANNNNYYAELWYLIDPLPSCSYCDIDQTQQYDTRVVIGAVSYSGVDQVTGIGNITNATGTSTKSNVNITTTAANSVLVDVETSASTSSLTNGAGQTQRYKDTSLNNIYGGGEEMRTTTMSTYNMNWTLGGSGAAWVNIAAEIKPHTSLTGSRIKVVTENGVSAYAIAP